MDILEAEGFYLDFVYSKVPGAVQYASLFIDFLLQRVTSNHTDSHALRLVCHQDQTKIPIVCFSPSLCGVCEFILPSFIIKQNHCTRRRIALTPLSWMQ